MTRSPTPIAVRFPDHTAAARGKGGMPACRTVLAAPPSPAARGGAERKARATSAERYGSFLGKDAVAISEGERWGGPDGVVVTRPPENKFYY